jgi:hypothetical protein
VAVIVSRLAISETSQIGKGNITASEMNNTILPLTFPECGVPDWIGKEAKVLFVSRLTPMAPNLEGTKSCELRCSSRGSPNSRRIRKQGGHVSCVVRLALHPALLNRDEKKYLFQPFSPHRETNSALPPTTRPRPSSSALAISGLRSAYSGRKCSPRDECDGFRRRWVEMG